MNLRQFLTYMQQHMRLVFLVATAVACACLSWYAIPASLKLELCQVWLPLLLISSPAGLPYCLDLINPSTCEIAFNSAHTLRDVTVSFWSTGRLAAFELLHVLFQGWLTTVYSNVSSFTALQELNPANLVYTDFAPQGVELTAYSIGAGLGYIVSCGLLACGAIAVSDWNFFLDPALYSPVFSLLDNATLDHQVTGADLAVDLWQRASTLLEFGVFAATGGCFGITSLYNGTLSPNALQGPASLLSGSVIVATTCQWSVLTWLLSVAVDFGDSAAMLCLWGSITAISFVIVLCLKCLFIFLLVVLIRITTPRFKLETISKLGWLYTILALVIIVLLYFFGFLAF